MIKKKERNGIRPLKHISLITIFLCFLVLVGFAGSIYCWDNKKTHKDDLTGMALELVHVSTKNQEYSPEIWVEFAEAIKYGARDEDLPCDPFAGREIPYSRILPAIGLSDQIPHWVSQLIYHDLRANNHYGHGIVKGVKLTNSALSMGDKDHDPLNWAKTNPDLSYEEEFKGGGDWWSKKKGWNEKNDLDGGEMSWKRAIERYGYTRESKELAYYTLGFVLHLLQDMGEPEHVHDDPHGGSSYTGFEKYTEDHWNEIEPKIENLRPWRPKSKDIGKDKTTFGQGGWATAYGQIGEIWFPDIDDYFGRLGKIAYSATRFQGFKKKGGDPKKIEKGSDLEQMFDVEEIRETVAVGRGFYITERGWRLKNKAGTAGDRSLELKYFPDNYGKDPAGHKGFDRGEFWPTSRELENIGKNKVDAEGYYYIELSEDLPLKDPSGKYEETKWFGKRDLYPMAYLPTPLDEVKDECKGWETGSLDGKTLLYQIIAKNLAPHIVQYSAGLIQHYFDIVNHPPYVARVHVFQDKDEKYYALWEEHLEWRPGSNLINDLKERGRVVKTNKKLHPGKASMTISFSEPVNKPEVRILGAKGEPIKITNMKRDREDSTWQSYFGKDSSWEIFFEIPEKGPVSESLTICINASDKNRHFGEEGGQLDANPGTPARRGVTKNGGYKWEGYDESSATASSLSVKKYTDTNHILEIERAVVEPKVTIKSIKPIVPNMSELRLQYMYDIEAVAESAPNPIAIKADQHVNLNIEYVVYGKPDSQVEVRIDPSVIGWVYYKEPKSYLRLNPIKKIVRFGKNEAEKNERDSLSFSIAYPSQERWEAREKYRNHALRLDVMINNKKSYAIWIRSAFEVEGPGTDFAGMGNLNIRILLPEKEVRKEVYWGEDWHGPVKIIFQPLSSQSTPSPRVFGYQELINKHYGVFKEPPFKNIPLGRYRIVAEVQGDEKYSGFKYTGPRTGSAIVTLFKWNPTDQHVIQCFSADIRLGEALGEKGPSFIGPVGTGKAGDQPPPFIRDLIPKTTVGKSAVGATAPAPSAGQEERPPATSTQPPATVKKSRMDCVYQFCPMCKGAILLGTPAQGSDCDRCIKANQANIDRCVSQ